MPGKEAKKDFYTIVCASAEDFLNELSLCAVTVWDVHFLDAITIEFCALANDRKTIENVIRKLGASGKMSRENRLFSIIKQLKRRKFFVFGIVFIFFLSALLPTRVLFIQVAGNEKIADKEIIEAAQQCGVSFLSSRREVRSERMKNALLSAMPQLQWAGINTSGCTAIISVEERNEEVIDDHKDGVYSIVAARDGVIKSYTVKQGNALCRPGEAVKSGQVLVSGYTDCGLYIQATKAEGEITAETFRSLTVLSGKKSLQRDRMITAKSRYSLIIGKKLINLFKGSGILDTTCVKINEKYPLTLPGGFVLPLTIVREKVVYYEPVVETAEIWEEYDWLSSSARSYLTDNMVAGKILSEDFNMETEDDVIRFTGYYFCEEMIGKLRKEENVNTYVQNR